MGLKGFGALGQIRSSLLDHIHEVAEPGAVVRVMAPLVEVHGTAELQGSVVALPSTQLGLP